MAQLWSANHSYILCRARIQDLINGFMSNEDFNSLNGKDRRKGVDRRKSERRGSESDDQSGVLSARAGERRRKKRRSTDQQNTDEVKTKKKI
jgi:hypothetical protein